MNYFTFLWTRSLYLYNIGSFITCKEVICLMFHLKEEAKLLRSLRETDFFKFVFLVPFNICGIYINKYVLKSNITYVLLNLTCKLTIGCLNNWKDFYSCVSVLQDRIKSDVYGEKYIKIFALISFLTFLEDVEYLESQSINIKG